MTSAGDVAEVLEPRARTADPRMPARPAPGHGAAGRRLRRGRSLRPGLGPGRHPGPARRGVHAPSSRSTTSPAGSSPTGSSWPTGTRSAAVGGRAARRCGGATPRAGGWCITRARCCRNPRPSRIPPGPAPPLHSPPMTDVDEQGRPEPPLAGDETATLLGFLDYQRATLAWKCAGLDAAGLGATVGASSMTLGGMLKHLAYVEDRLVLPVAARAGPAAAVGHGGLEGRPRLGLALGRRGHPRAAPRALAGRRGPLPRPWSPRRWPTAAWSSWPGAPGPTAGRPACAGSWST